MDVGTVLVVTVAVALIFDVINGFHDAANSIATVVSTRVLSPRAAVVWAAVFNFVALFLFGEGVAKTIAKMIKIDVSDPAFMYVVLTGLVGAIIWNLLTWWWGLPSSSSHALLGGLGGAGVTYAGRHVLVLATVKKTVLFIVLSPLLGFVGSYIIMTLVFWVFRSFRPTKVDRWFRRGQLVSAAAYSIGHGANDAQKTMGVIAAAMVATGRLPHDFKSVPSWVYVASYGAMALGTALGGWRIVKTMGMRLTKLRPVGGFCAEVAGAVALFTSASLKVPVSTTHTITGAIIGVGTTTKVRGVRWGLASRIVWAWIFTIPAAALVSALCFEIVKYAWHPW
jgi:PiT family inorganic phosphate transporter